MPVDPRDIVWESDAPTYRVYFWSHPDRGSDEWRLTGASSVWEVLAWAEEHAGQARTFQLFLEVSGDPGPGLLRLAGSDPTRDLAVVPSQVST